MKKSLFLLFFLFSAAMIYGFDTTEIKTDFADKTTLRGKAGYFRNQEEYKAGNIKRKQVKRK